jgi:hypothetical protein
MKDAYINLLLPGQSSRYSVLYNVYNDLAIGLGKLGLKSRILFIKFNEMTAEFPYHVPEFKEVDINRVQGALNDDEFCIIPDDFSLLKHLNKYRLFPKNSLIWAHYLYGHKFIFKKYRDIPFENFKANRWFKLLEYLPIKLLYSNNGFYRSALARYPVVAQSLWTLLLLERVYNLRVIGLLRIPVEESIYPMQDDKEDRALIYLGNLEDTDLNALRTTLKILNKVDSGLQFDAFGDERMSSLIEKSFRVNYLGKLERVDLSREYGRHLLTISPIYNGNFEMVPIESLLCGTPTITFPQPFMEVTGDSPMIANIEYAQELKSKLQLWKGEMGEHRKRVRERVLEEMDNKVVARNLVYDYLSGLSQAF